MYESETGMEGGGEEEGGRSVGEGEGTHMQIVIHHLFGDSKPGHLVVR